MVNAYVLVQTEVGQADFVAQEIAKLQGVQSAEDVIGPYDVIVRVEAESVDALGPMVMTDIQDIKGIDRTVTCTVVRS